MLSGNFCHVRFKCRIGGKQRLAILGSRSSMASALVRVVTAKMANRVRIRQRIVVGLEMSGL